MTDEETVEYGREAAAVVGNRAYQQAFADIERAIVDRLAGDNLTADDVLDLQMMLSAGRRYRKALERAMANGKFIVESLKREKEYREGL